MTENTAPGNGETLKHQCLCMGLGPMVTSALRQMGPPEAALGHFRSARIEFLKGIRAIIDERIGQMQSAQQKGTKVTVE
jgi:hypothetical protein